MLRARVIGVESEPMRFLEKTKRRQRHVKTVKSKHRFTVLRIFELRVKGKLEDEEEGVGRVEGVEEVEGVEGAKKGEDINRVEGLEGVHGMKSLERERELKGTYGSKPLKLGRDEPPRNRGYQRIPGLKTPIRIKRLKLGIENPERVDTE